MIGLTIDEEYRAVLQECFFISKPDEWFLEGLEADLETLYSLYKNGDTFNSNSAIMRGLTLETYDGCKDDIPRVDGEGCPLTEFEIYDKWGNEISELTLNEYKSLLREKKIDHILP